MLLYGDRFKPLTATERFACLSPPAKTTPSAYDLFLCFIQLFTHQKRTFELLILFCWFDFGLTSNSTTTQCQLLLAHWPLRQNLRTTTLLKVIFWKSLLKVNFHRIERVLFMKVFFHIRWAVIASQKHVTLLRGQVWRGGRMKRFSMLTDLLKSHECLCDITHTSYKNRMI